MKISKLFLGLSRSILEWRSRWGLCWTRPCPQSLLGSDSEWVLEKEGSGWVGGGANLSLEPLPRTCTCRCGPTLAQAVLSLCKVNSGHPIPQTSLEVLAPCLTHGGHAEQTLDSSKMGSCSP